MYCQKSPPEGFSVSLLDSPNILYTRSTPSTGRNGAYTASTFDGWVVDVAAAFVDSIDRRIRYWGTRRIFQGSLLRMQPALVAANAA